jgi:hypothetical protein
MSDTSQGPGWWLASDGKWYSPEQATPQAPSAPAPVSANPVQSQTDPQAQQTTIAINAAMIPPLVAIGAGILVALGSLLAWATVSAGIINASAAGTNGDGKITLIFGGVAVATVILFITMRNIWWIVGAVVAFLVALGVSVYDTVNVSSTHVGNDVIQANVSVGIGLWLCLIASIVGVATSVYLVVKEREKRVASR